MTHDPSGTFPDSGTPQPSIDPAGSYPAVSLAPIVLNPDSEPPTGNNGRPVVSNVDSNQPHVNGFMIGGGLRR